MSCSSNDASFDEIVLTEPTAAQYASFSESITFAASFFSSGDPDIVGTLLTDYALNFIATVIWPMLMLAFLIIFALPLCIARCCCTKSCCKPKENYVLPGYPCGGCCGYGAAALAWLVFWLMLVILAIYLPFALWNVGHALANWVDAVCASVEATVALLDDAIDVVASVINIVLTHVQDIANLATNMLDGLLADLVTLDTIVTNITASLLTGCSELQNSSAFQNLTALSPALAYDCSSLDIGSGTASQISSINTIINDAKDTVNGLVDTVNSTLSAADSITEVLESLQGEIVSVVDGIFNASVPLSIDAVIAGDMGSGSSSPQEITDEVVAIFPALIAIPSVFTYLGLFFFGIGFLLLSCIKCAANREKDGSSSSGLSERNREIKNGCCGRCMTKFGCVCSYCGAFVLSFFAIITLLMVPITMNVVTAYYVAPYQLDETVTTIEAALDSSLGENVTTYISIIDGCFFGSGSLSDIASALGFDLDELLSSFSIGDTDISQYTNFTPELDSARAAMDTGEATLQGFKYSPTQISAAEDAGLRCCNYAALFSEFTSDCGDGSSVCFQCENVAAPSDCVSDPNTCNPSPSDNSGLNKLCNDLANNALTLMTQQNDLVDSQSPSFDKMRAVIDDIEARDIGGTLQDTLETVDATLPAELTAEIDTASCSAVGQIYYGLYEVLLEPIARALVSFAVVLTLVVFVSIVLVWVNIPLNVRLGNDGIDVNNVAETSPENVNVEMVTIHDDEDPLPVAEPVATSDPADSRQAAYHADKIDDYGGQDY